MKTILTILALSVFITASNKIPYINHLIYEISKSNFNKDVINAHKNKTYKQHYTHSHDNSQYKFIGFYKNFAIFFFDEYETQIFENKGIIYSRKNSIGIQSGYILVKKQKETVYLKGYSFLLGHFRLVGVKDLHIYPYYNLKAIELKQINKNIN